MINVIDNFSIKAYLSDYDTPVIIEFERPIPKQLNGKIELCGELQMNRYCDSRFLSLILQTFRNIGTESL